MVGFVYLKFGTIVLRVERPYNAELFLALFGEPEDMLKWDDIIDQYIVIVNNIFL